MVVFICNACGESVKKNAVDKHCQTQCRNCAVLSCIDCGKDFPGETFRSHNQCMTEEEKWHGKDFKPKEGANTGKKKQDAWTESLQEAAGSAQAKNPHLAGLIQKLLTYENVPRKEVKFKNFLKNCMRIYDYQIVSALWSIVSAGPKSAANGKPSVVSQNVQSSEPFQNVVEPAPGSGEVSVEPEASVETDAPDTEAKESVPNKKFKWKRSITQALAESESHTLRKKKLRKKVLQQYLSHSSDVLLEEDLNEKFEKYLLRYSSLFSVEDKSVRLLAA